MEKKRKMCVFSLIFISRTALMQQTILSFRDENIFRNKPIYQAPKISLYNTINPRYQSKPRTFQEIVVSLWATQLIYNNSYNHDIPWHYLVTIEDSDQNMFRFRFKCSMDIYKSIVRCLFICLSKLLQKVSVWLHVVFDQKLEKRRQKIQAVVPCQFHKSF